MILLLFGGKEEKTQGHESALGKAAADVISGHLLSVWSPILNYAGSSPYGLRWSEGGGMLSLFSFLQDRQPVVLQAESGWTRDDIIRAEGRDEYSEKMASEDMETPGASEGRLVVDAEFAQRLMEENRQEEDESLEYTESGESGSAENKDGNPDSSTAVQETKKSDPAQGKSEAQIAQYIAEPTEKKEVYQWEYYKKYDALVNEFYAIDASTAADENQLNLNDLLTPDMSVAKRTDEEPQILIYHTHSQEAFADSVEGDPSTTIMGVGQVLTQILQEGYGYNVMHHLGQYDVENRDYAYNTALPVMEQLLAEYPTIEVVIDLHRDEVAEGTKLVTTVDGRPTARFMFFNGLSRTRKHGDIEYLPNENIVANLAFSFQMQTLCNQYYPGLTRRIYLKGYRYNMHLKPRYLLIEMGAQTNSYQECYNACIPLARILDMELSGADFGYETE